MQISLQTKLLLLKDQVSLNCMLFVSRHRFVGKIWTRRQWSVEIWDSKIIHLHLYLFQRNQIKPHKNLSWSVDRGFEPHSGQTKDYAIGICSFSAKHAVLRRRAKTGWLLIRIMCPSGTTCLPADCFQRASTIKIQLSVLV